MQTANIYHENSIKGDTGHRHSNTSAPHSIAVAPPRQALFLKLEQNNIAREVAIVQVCFHHYFSRNALDR